jgi:hypothetical protein
VLVAAFHSQGSTWRMGAPAGAEQIAWRTARRSCCRSSRFADGCHRALLAVSGGSLRQCEGRLEHGGPLRHVGRRRGRGGVLLGELLSPPGRPAAADAVQRGEQHAGDGSLSLIAAASRLGDEWHDLLPGDVGEAHPGLDRGGASCIDGVRYVRSMRQMG